MNLRFRFRYDREDFEALLLDGIRQAALINESDKCL